MVMVILLVVSLITGTIYQSKATAYDMTLYPAPGDLIAVDGTDMHIYCVGEGSPTVLFEAGLGGNYMDWIQVQSTIAEQTRTCAYDRSTWVNRNDSRTTLYDCGVSVYTG